MPSNPFEPGFDPTPQADPWPNAIPSTQQNTDPTDNRGAQLAASGYQLPPELLYQNSGNLSAQLSGLIPQSDVDYLRTKAAQFGVSSGTVGSDLAGNQGLRSLGLMQLDQQNKAADRLMPFYNNPMAYANLARRPVVNSAQPGTTGVTGPVRSPVSRGGGSLVPMTDPATGRSYLQAVGANGIGSDLVNAYGPRSGGGSQGGQSPLPWWASNSQQIGATKSNPMGSYDPLWNDEQLWGAQNPGTPYNGGGDWWAGGYDPLMSDQQAGDWVNSGYQDYGTGEFAGGGSQSYGSNGDWADETGQQGYADVGAAVGAPYNAGDTNEDNFWS